jgi:hypothetical protein
MPTVCKYLQIYNSILSRVDVSTTTDSGSGRDYADRRYFYTGFEAHPDTYPIGIVLFTSGESCLVVK